MISKIREKLNLLDLIVDSAEENNGFTNLDKQAALDAVRDIYDFILTTHTVNVESLIESSDIEVSVYGVSEIEGIEIEIEKYETHSLNSDCEFEIENKLESKIDDSDFEKEDCNKLTDNEVLEEEVLEETLLTIPNEEFVDSMIKENAPLIDTLTQEPIIKIAVDETDIPIVIEKILDIQIESDHVLEQEELYTVKKEEEIVYASDQELLFDETDLLFTEEQKAIIVDGLFNGDISQCDDFIKKISLFTDFDEAIIYLQEHYSDINNEVALEIIAEKLSDKLM